jgi:hypothetical protein
MESAVTCSKNALVKQEESLLLEVFCVVLDDTLPAGEVVSGSFEPEAPDIGCEANYKCECDAVLKEFKGCSREASAD